MNDELIINILNYITKLNTICYLLGELPRDKTKDYIKKLYNIDLDELEKLL